MHAVMRAGDDTPLMILKTCKKITNPSEDSEAQPKPTTTPEVKTGGVDHGYPPCPMQARGGQAACRNVDREQ
jgi:hypothetical protein